MHTLLVLTDDNVSGCYCSQGVTDWLPGYINLGTNDERTAGSQDRGIPAYVRAVGCYRNSVADHGRSIGNDRYAVANGSGVSHRGSITRNDRGAVGDDLWGTGDHGRISGNPAWRPEDGGIGYHGPISGVSERTNYKVLGHCRSRQQNGG